MSAVRTVLFVGLAACTSASIGDGPGLGAAADGGHDASADVFDGGVGPDAMLEDCVPGSSQLLLNPGFDEGAAGWAQSGGALIVAANALPISTQSGSHAARLLSDNDADHSLSQPVAVPRYTSALELAVHKCWVTADSSGDLDQVNIELVDTAGAVVEVLLAISNEDATSGCNWSPLSLPSPRPHPGEDLTLRFRGSSDSAFFTSIYFDTLALTATVTCP